MSKETAQREHVLKLLGLTLEAAGMPGIKFRLIESERRPDVVEVLQHGRHCTEACIDYDSLTELIRDVLGCVI